MRAPYLLRSMSPTPFANSPPTRDSTSCYLSTLGMEMSTAGAIVLKACAQPGVLFKIEKRTPPLHSSGRLTAVLGPLALLWKSLTEFMVLLSNFLLKRAFFYLLSPRTLKLFPFYLILGDPTHHDRGNLSLNTWVPETLLFFISPSAARG